MSKKYLLLIGPVPFGHGAVLKYRRVKKQTSFFSGLPLDFGSRPKASIIPSDTVSFGLTIPALILAGVVESC
jgi:hypothetical protein